MSIVTEISRLKSAKSAIAAAIAGKGVTVPDGTMLDGMAALIESIEAGGVRVEQGSVTFAEAQNTYTFVADSPDIFIAYVEDDSAPQHISSKYVWMIIQDTRLFDYYGAMGKTSYILGYNEGTSKYYTPFKSSCDKIGKFSLDYFMGSLGAKTYKWYAIYGVTAT